MYPTYYYYLFPYRDTIDTIDWCKKYITTARTGAHAWVQICPWWVVVHFQIFCSCFNQMVKKHYSLFLFHCVTKYVTVLGTSISNFICVDQAAEGFTH